jgi:Domain of unknown function (DUF3471)
MQAKVEEDRLANCTQRLHPSLLDSPLGRSVSFDKYVGNFTNAGYGTVTISKQCRCQDPPKNTPALPTTNKDGCHLVIHKHSQLMDMELQLQHMSGDYWVGWAFMEMYRHYYRPTNCLRVQFAVDATGTVSRVGIDVRFEGDEIPLVWFDRTSG